MVFIKRNRKFYLEIVLMILPPSKIMFSFNHISKLIINRSC